MRPVWRPQGFRLGAPTAPAVPPHPLAPPPQLGGVPWPQQPASGRAKVEEPPRFHLARHHEDAGIGYNVFRATVAANASTLLVPAAPAGASSVPPGRSSPYGARAPAPLGLATRHGAPRRSY